MMGRNTIIIGLLLCLVGAIGWFAADPLAQSKTAWIPAFFGLPMILLGAIAARGIMVKHAMHVAAVLALLGFGGSFSRAIPALVRGEVASNLALACQAAMMILCAIFIWLAMQSFKKARRERLAG